MGILGNLSGMDMGDKFNVEGLSAAGGTSAQSVQFANVLHTKMCAMCDNMRGAAVETSAPSRGRS